MAAFSAHDLRSVESPSIAPSGRVNPHARQLNELAEMMAQHRGRRIISATILEGLVRLCELALTMIVGLATYLLVVAPVTGVAVLPLLAIPLVSTLLVIVMQALGCYRVAAMRAPTRFGLRISASWFALFAAIFAACWFAQTSAIFDKAWLGHWTFFGFLAISAERFLLRSRRIT